MSFPSIDEARKRQKGMKTYAHCGRSQQEIINSVTGDRYVSVSHAARVLKLEEREIRLLLEKGDLTRVCASPWYTNSIHRV